MNISEKQIERFTEHVLALEAQRQDYKWRGEEEYARKGFEMIDSMLYTARFFGLPVPIVYKNGSFQRTEE